MSAPKCIRSPEGTAHLYIKSLLVDDACLLVSARFPWGKCFQFSLVKMFDSWRQSYLFICLSVQFISASVYSSIHILLNTLVVTAFCFCFLLPTILTAIRANQQGILLTCSVYCNIALVSQDPLSNTNIWQILCLQASEVLALNAQINEQAENVLHLHGFNLWEYLYTYCHLHVFI